MISYPQGLITPHGAYEVRKGDTPMVSLVSSNGQVVFWLMGGQSKPDPTMPESAQVKSLSGLIAPWEFIDQQGATQDGVSFVDALYGPTDINMDVELIARNAKHLRQMRRHLHDCLHPHEQSELGWMTPELGYWWAPVRWGKTDQTPERGAQKARQSMTLRLRGDNAFWQSWPDISQCYGSSPLSAFASECRSWADEVGSPRATLAFGYAHSLRQLKYPDVAAQIAIAIAQACAGAI